MAAGGAHRTYGAYFPDLASNMLGSFVMGILTSASALKAESARAIAILPEDHAWQDTPELLVGLRTGFCGSLTTFASWQLSLVSLLIGGRGYDGGQWAEFLWGLVIGFQLSLSSYMFGAHLAANLDAFFMASGTRKGQKSTRKGSHQGALEDKKASRQGNSTESSQAAPTTDREAEAGWDLEERGQIQGKGSKQASSGLRLQGQGSDDDDGWSAEEQGSPHMDKMAAPSTQSKNGFQKTHLSVLFMVILLTSLWIVLAVVDSKSQHLQRRRQWFALLFAPFGAMLRWKLSLLNGSVAGLKWFPSGTLAANLLACCVDFGLQAGMQRIAVPGYWVQLLFRAVQVGFSGALSTVSTFVAEVHAMPGEKADNVHGYIYGFLTISLGALSGVVIYGWSVWA